MQKTEILLPFSVKGVPVGSNCFQESESADDVGLDKGFRTPDGSVNMALGGKMYYGSGSIALK
jgi:hypothetical protein